jgi:hypothetical protein
VDSLSMTRVASLPVVWIVTVGSGLTIGFHLGSMLRFGSFFLAKNGSFSVQIWDQCLDFFC